MGPASETSPEARGWSRRAPPGPNTRSPLVDRDRVRALRRPDPRRRLGRGWVAGQAGSRVWGSVVVSLVPLEGPGPARWPWGSSGSQRVGLGPGSGGGSPGSLLAESERSSETLRAPGGRPQSPRQTPGSPGGVRPLLGQQAQHPGPPRPKTRPARPARPRSGRLLGFSRWLALPLSLSSRGNQGTGAPEPLGSASRRPPGLRSPLSPVEPKE